MNAQASQPAAMNPKDGGSLSGGGGDHADGGKDRGDHVNDVNGEGAEKESMQGLDGQASLATMPPQVSTTLLDDTLAPEDQSPTATMSKDDQSLGQNMHPNQDEHWPQKLRAFSNAPPEGIAEKTNAEPDPHGSHEPAEPVSAEKSVGSADKSVGSADKAEAEADAMYTFSHAPGMIPGLFEPADSGDESGPYDPGPEPEVTGGRGDGAGKVAHSLEDSMSFWDYCLDELEDSQQLMDLVSAMEGDSVSTAFSGVDAPKVAMNCLHWCLESRLATQIPKTRTLFSIEWNQEAQKELLLLDVNRNKDDHKDQSDMPCIFVT